MSASYLLALTALAAFVAVVAATIAVLTVRRGADAALKGDVSDLAVLVERLAKAHRREQMSRVRRGEKDPLTASEGFPIPPGAEGIALSETPPLTAKEELRRRVMANRR